MSIVPPEEAAKGPREITPIGTCPYRMGELVKDSHLVLRRIDDYRAGSPGTPCATGTSGSSDLAWRGL